MGRQSSSVAGPPRPRPRPSRLAWARPLGAPAWRPDQPSGLSGGPAERKPVPRLLVAGRWPTSREAGTGVLSIRESFTDERFLLVAGAVLSGTRRRRREGARDFCSHFVAILVAPFVLAHGLDRLCVGLGQRSHDLLGREGVVAGHWLASLQPMQPVEYDRAGLVSELIALNGCQLHLREGGELCPELLGIEVVVVGDGELIFVL